MLNSHAIYSNCIGQLSQNNIANTFVLSIKNKEYSFTPKELRILFKSIKKIDLSIYFDKNYTTEIIFLPQLDKIFILDIIELVQFKDLIMGSIFMIELNTILESTLYISF